jgi:hypothetical protein
MNIPLIICCWPDEEESSAFLVGIAGYLKKPDLKIEDFQAILNQ